MIWEELLTSEDCSEEDEESKWERVVHRKEEGELCANSRKRHLQKASSVFSVYSHGEGIASECGHRGELAPESPQTCPQANLMEEFSQLRFLFPDN